ncbi:DoxX family protein [Pseudonocardia sp. DSM 110487]|uniref:DoxX family protein n=1 Tax=Pseudonocardia sp. DSM 110487 TaxID=2865833 RepID=UPI001C69D712|nr:DoxX family protein [Pseudonocardia sp. DSM 110487]QYN33786.1 DoxX family protein [Pseudonocardia sp. DSM 110487]
MNIVLWILAALLAVAFLVAGGMKLAQPKEKLAASPNMAWAQDFSPGMLKTIGALEVLAAIGLILPAVLGIVPVLVPLAAVGLILLMAGAAITHARRGESRAIAANVVLIVLAAVVAWGRFGPYPFA